MTLGTELQTNRQTTDCTEGGGLTREHCTYLEINKGLCSWLDTTTTATIFLEPSGMFFCNSVPRVIVLKFQDFSQIELKLL
jgi:hypothetical protein